MSAYQDGYDKGYADGSAGNPSDRQSAGMDIADMLTSWDENLTEWEEGYDKGYEDGKAEWDSQRQGG